MYKTNLYYLKKSEERGEKSDGETEKRASVEAFITRAIEVFSTSISLADGHLRNESCCEFLGIIVLFIPRSAVTFSSVEELTLGAFIIEFIGIGFANSEVGTRSSIIGRVLNRFWRKSHTVIEEVVEFSASRNFFTTGRFVVVDQFSRGFGTVCIIPRSRSSIKNRSVETRAESILIPSSSARLNQ